MKLDCSCGDVATPALTLHKYNFCQTAGALIDFDLRPCAYFHNLWKTLDYLIRANVCTCPRSYFIIRLANPQCVRVSVSRAMRRDTLSWCAVQMYDTESQPPEIGFSAKSRKFFSAVAVQPVHFYFIFFSALTMRLSLNWTKFPQFNRNAIKRRRVLMCYVWVSGEITQNDKTRNRFFSSTFSKIGIFKKVE